MDELKSEPESDALPVPKPTAGTLSEEEKDQTLPQEADNGSKTTVTFQGNSYDLASVVGVTVGGVVLLTCATCNMGYYCLPVLPIALGVIGLVAAEDSVNPERTKMLSWISLGSGAAILLLILVFIIAYVGLIAFVFAADSSSF